MASQSHRFTALEMLYITTALKGDLNAALWEIDLIFTVCLSAVNRNTSRSVRMAFSPLALGFFLIGTFGPLAEKVFLQSSVTSLRKKFYSKKITSTKKQYPKAKDNNLALNEMFIAPDSTRNSVFQMT